MHREVDEVQNSDHNWGHYLNDEGSWRNEENRDSRSSKAAALLRVIGSLAPISVELYSAVVVWRG